MMYHLKRHWFPSLFLVIVAYILLPALLVSGSQSQPTEQDWYLTIVHAQKLAKEQAAELEATKKKVAVLEAKLQQNDDLLHQANSDTTELQGQINKLQAYADQEHAAHLAELAARKFWCRLFLVTLAITVVLLLWTFRKPIMLAISGV